MPNFPKVSRFDDGELPPDKEYVDWTKASTRVLTVAIQDNSTADATLKIINGSYTIVEELLVGLSAEIAGKIVVRIKK